MVLPRCPNCRSIEFRGVGVRNSVERALNWLCFRTAARSADAISSCFDGELRSKGRLSEKHRLLYVRGSVN
jgi:hypothetical protein